MNLRFQPRGPARAPNRLGLFGYVATTIVVASGLIASYFGLQPTVERWLLERWENQLTELDETVAPGVMADAASQGTWGLRMLVQGTLSANEPIQQAACRELELQLERWAHDSADHSGDVMQLAQMLVSRFDRYNENQQRELRSVVQRVTNWPIDKRQVQTAAFLANCETLVRRIAEIRLASVAKPLSARTTPTLVNPDTPPLTVSPPSPPPNPPASNDASLIPVDPAPSVVPPKNNPDLMLEKLPIAPDNIRRIPPRNSEPKRPTAEAPPATPNRDVLRLAHERLETMGDWDVITHFHSNEINPQWVEAELMRRGYQARDLAIARRASHPDVRVRKQLVEDLPQMKGIDARLWLQQLAQDEAVEVRTKALGILRTVADPRLYQTRM